MKVNVGIVLYNPNIDTLLKSIDELEEVVTNFFLVDNNSQNINEIERKIKNKKVNIIKNKENMGIAKALNQLLEKAYKDKTDYLLTLDQDSIIQKDMFKKMLEYHEIESPAIICPRIVDINRKKQVKYNGKYENVDRCITSGSLMNLKICKKIGMFDEKMFIDYVDFDYCKRIKNNNETIIRVNDSIIKHEIGKRTRHHFLFWEVYPTNHNANRIFYYFRNVHYYYLKHKNNMNLSEKRYEIIRLLWKYVSIILYEKDKTNKLKEAKRGFKEAKNMIG